MTRKQTKQLGNHDQDPEEALVPQAWEVENGLGPRVTWRSLLWFYPRFIDIGGKSVSSIARERKIKRAQWLRFT